MCCTASIVVVERDLDAVMGEPLGLEFLRRGWADARFEALAVTL